VRANPSHVSVLGDMGFPWFGDQIDGSVIPLHSHGHNRPTHDETSYPPTNTLSVYLSYSFHFLTENNFTSFLGIPR
jgi:hypothetical protein